VTEREAQKRKILNWMLSGMAITQQIATDLFDCTRLGARIYDLRRDGVPVQSGWEYKLDKDGKVEKKWKRYWIAVAQ